MSESAMGVEPEQGHVFESEEARSLFDQLLADSQLFTRSAEYKALLDFVVRLRNFAPFNAMLLRLAVERASTLTDHVDTDDAISQRGGAEEA